MRRSDPPKRLVLGQEAVAAKGKEITAIPLLLERRPPEPSGGASPTNSAPKVPKLATLMDAAETDVLAYMTFPAQHRTKLHSTNPLERLNVSGVFRPRL